jgi:hypothetical protein
MIGQQYYPQLSNKKKAKMAATGRRPFWIFVIVVTFKQFDRFLMKFGGPLRTSKG